MLDRGVGVIRIRGLLEPGQVGISENRPVAVTIGIVNGRTVHRCLPEAKSLVEVCRVAADFRTDTQRAAEGGEHEHLPWSGRCGRQRPPVAIDRPIKIGPIPGSVEPYLVAAALINQALGAPGLVTSGGGG